MKYAAVPVKAEINIFNNTFIIFLSTNAPNTIPEKAILTKVTIAQNFGTFSSFISHLPTSIRSREQIINPFFTAVPLIRYVRALPAKTAAA